MVTALTPGAPVSPLRPVAPLGPCGPVAPCGPAAPWGPRGPVGPDGPRNAVRADFEKSRSVRDSSRTLADVTAPCANSDEPTESARSCADPTLLRGSVIAA